MRRIALGLMSTLSGLVLLFSYHTSTNSGTAVTADEGSATTSSSSGSTSSGDGDSSGSTSSDTGSSGSAGSGGDGTYTGDPVETRWGPVQVEITVQDGRIVASEAVVYPQENHRDVEINSYAVPVYDEEAVDAQSADIDVVSGATVTWQGYTRSLQSAIDQAGI
jgi:uncharacterized protein with FMN-binding domain